MNPVVAINRRARSAEQKALRRQAVLDAAETYFLEVGYEAFSMTQLAKKAGVVKALFIFTSKRGKRFFLPFMNKA